MSISEIFNKDDVGEKLIKFADEKGLALSKTLKRSQIRMIFTEARRIEAEWELNQQSAIRRLILLKAKLAYQAKRHSEVEPLRVILVDAIDQVAQASETGEKTEKFHRFMELFEAILAYHRFYGGSG